MNFKHRVLNFDDRKTSNKKAQKESLGKDIQNVYYTKDGVLYFLTINL